MLSMAFYNWVSGFQLPFENQHVWLTNIGSLRQIMWWQVVSQGYAQSISLLMVLLKYQSPTVSAIVWGQEVSESVATNQKEISFVLDRSVSCIRLHNDLYITSKLQAKQQKFLMQGILYYLHLDYNILRNNMIWWTLA